MDLPNTVEIVEVSPRDGLQNEQRCLSSTQRANLVVELAAAGLQKIECGSFVSPKWVPQMANTDDVIALCANDIGDNCSLSALTPNIRGATDALATNVNEIAVFTATSNTFTRKNQGCNIEQTLQQISDIVNLAKQKNVPVRGYLSCITDCPYEGHISPQVTAEIAQHLIQLGCYQVSLGDTTGVASAACIEKVLNQTSKYISPSKLAGHFHNTMGQALANTLTALQMGVRVFDSSVAGLGGCPFAGGDNGNLASEDLVYFLHKMNIDTGVDLNKLIAVGHNISQLLGRPSRSMVANTLSCQTT